MENKLDYSKKAIRDLENIWEYISIELANPEAARGIINGLFKSIDNLQQFPKLGVELLFDDNMNTGYRFVIYKNYIIFYHIEANVVSIDRIMYKKRDYMRLLFS